MSGSAAMKVKIKCWNGVATWLWVANDENCGICRMAFNGCCPDCKCPAMTALWCGASAPTVSTCTASSSGCMHNRCSSTAPCAARSGSSRSESPAASTAPGLSPHPHLERTS
ncbi:anaphase-promoting complex subunit 11 isoform X3 [Carlito syrichta]|uniref:Anaphase-promoting complex subunit 11 isoform X3 n=1 Tax=Carlito syrichta TaxID=1868482 RepID=A0A3Q0DYR8_CARSF|nr:anaphase-promoting complex subunit 11 isoform X3 [Carlito syrichta]